MTGGLVMIVRGYSMLALESCLGYQIFNFLDGKKRRNEMRVVYNKPERKTIFFNKKEMREIRKQFLLDEEHNNPNKSFRFVGGTDGKEH